VDERKATCSKKEEMTMGEDSTSTKFAKAFDVPSRRDFLCPIVAGVASAVLLPQPMAAAAISAEWTGSWMCVMINTKAISDLQVMSLTYFDDAGGVRVQGSVQSKGASVNHSIQVDAKGNMLIYRTVGGQSCETALRGTMNLISHDRLEWHITSSDGGCNFYTTESRIFDRVEE
jgi:hypothetical protein